MSGLGGGLDRSTQHFILEGKDGVYDDGSEIWSRVYGGREDGVMGSLAAGRVAQSDWAGVWQAVIFHLLPGGTAWRHSSGCSASLAVSADTLGTRGDIERHCGTSIGTIDGTIAEPFSLDGEPRNQPQWRL